MGEAPQAREESGARTRRTRFVCIADTHNRNVKLPKGDVLILAGDITNLGTYAEVGLVCELSKYVR